MSSLMSDERGIPVLVRMAEKAVFSEQKGAEVPLVIAAFVSLRACLCIHWHAPSQHYWLNPQNISRLSLIFLLLMYLSPEKEPGYLAACVQKLG